MKVNPHGGYGVSSPTRRRDASCSAVPLIATTSRPFRPAATLPETVWPVSARSFDLVVPHGSTLWGRPDGQFPEVAPFRTERPEVERLGMVRRIVAAIRRWRQHARSRRELRELSDLMLRDIGLRREDAGHPFVPPLWYLERTSSEPIKHQLFGAARQPPCSPVVRSKSLGISSAGPRTPAQ
jgi:uncharacterized protein YjiS (DUF1127 family)